MDQDILEQTIRRQQAQYFGKYRAFVVDNADPEQLGRLRLRVPSVLGDAVTAWALPCVPFGGLPDQGFFMVPENGAQVLAEFLEGDPSAPIWTGTFWQASGDVPAEAAKSEPTTRLIKTPSGHLLQFDDESGAETVRLRHKGSAELAIDQDGVVNLTDQNGARLTLDAAAGEVVVEDTNGNTLTMSSSGIALKDASGNIIEAKAGGVTVKSGAVVTIEGSQVALGGAGGEPLLKGTSFLGLFNAHVHNATSLGAPTSPPLTPLTPAMLSTKVTTS